MVSVFIHMWCIVIIMTIYYDSLLWKCHKIMLWLTINLLVGVTSTSCSLGELYIIWMVKEGYDTVQGGKPF